MSINSNSSFSRMRRYPDQGWVAGVCAGVAEFFGWNLKLVRVLVALALFFSGFFPVGVIYLGLWYVLDPERGDAPHSGHRHSDEPSPYPPSSPYRAQRSSGDVKARFSRLEDRLRGLEECVTSKDFELRRELRKLEG